MSSSGVGAVLGLVYGAVWWALGPLLIMPAQVGMPLFTVVMAVNSLLGHLVFGLVLGLALAALRRRARPARARRDGCDRRARHEARAHRARERGLPGCARSRALVQEVRARHPGLDVRVVDLDAEPGYRVPVGVLGTPSWLLDGHPRWAGNPSLAEVGRALAGQDVGQLHPGEAFELALSGSGSDTVEPPRRPDPIEDTR